VARKPSREALEAELKRVSLERDMLSRLVNIVMRGPSGLDGEEIVETYGADVYALRLFDATGPSGGLIAVTFKSGAVNQKPLTSVYPLDSYYDGLLRAAHGSTEAAELLNAVGRLKVERNKLLEGEREIRGT
jgi:hypothetical protein